MPLFSRRDAGARARTEGERVLRMAGAREAKAARSMAARAGYDVAGAEHVAYEAPRTQRCLVVRPDRVDLYVTPDDDADPQRIWRREVRDVRVEDGVGLLAVVEVRGPDLTLSVEIPRTQAHLLHRLLSDREPHHGAEPGTGSAPTSHLDLLRQLATMRDEGLVTPDEYAAKKAEILGRM